MRVQKREMSSNSSMVFENFVQLAIPRFDGHLVHWRMLMENFLMSMKYWQVIEIGVAAPVDRMTLTDTQ